MNELPDLALLKVFSFFEVDELLLIRLVCKKWNLFFEQCLLSKSLFVYEHRYPSAIRWPTTNRPIRSNEALNLMKVISNVKRRFPAIQNVPWTAPMNGQNLMFRSIECLFVYRSANELFFLNQLYLLKQQLKVLHICNSPERCAPYLDLPYLEIFKFVGKVDPWTLIAPNLQSLIYWQLDYQGFLPFTIPHTFKINFVETLHFDEKYLAFKSLKSLTCLHIGAIPDTLLSELPHLKKLNLFPTEAGHRRIIENLKAKRSKLNRDDLRILVSGHSNEDLPFMFKMAATLRYYEEVLFCRDQVAELVSNFDRLIEPIAWNIRIHYNLLETSLFRLPGNYIMADFFVKFSNIKEILIDSGASQRLVLQFLTGCRTFELLRLNNCGFTQQFHDYLPKLDSISILIIAERSKDIDFGFLANFSSLNFLSIKYRGLPIDLISQTYQNNTIDAYHRGFSFFYFDFYSLNSDLKISIRSSHKNFITSFKINAKAYETKSACDVFHILRTEERIRHYLI